nr:MAG TPA: Single-strand binding protein family [Caudoviricetes sp.]
MTQENSTQTGKTSEFHYQNDCVVTGKVADFYPYHKYKNDFFPKMQYIAFLIEDDTIGDLPATVIINESMIVDRNLKKEELSRGIYVQFRGEIRHNKERYNIIYAHDISFMTKKQFKEEENRNYVGIRAQVRNTYNGDSALIGLVTGAQLTLKIESKMYGENSQITEYYVQANTYESKTTKEMNKYHVGDYVSVRGSISTRRYNSVTEGVYIDVENITKVNCNE